MEEEIKPYGIIYFVLNTLTGKYYIGQTVRAIRVRWRDHVHLSSKKENKATKNNHFYNALRFYGSKNFEVRVLFTCYDKATLNEAEIFFISLFDSTDRNLGYNSTFGGEGGRPTKETVEKRAKALLGRKKPPFTEEHRRHISEGVSKAQKGKPRGPRPPEQQRKMNESHKGVILPPKTPEECRRISDRQRGRKLPKEWCINISKGKTGKKFGPYPAWRGEAIKKGKAAAKARREEDKKEKECEN